MAQRLPGHAGDRVAFAAVLLTVVAAVAWALSSGRRLWLWIALRVDAPVFEARRAVLRLRRAEARSTLAAFGVATCLWLPSALLAIEVIGGPALLRSIDRGWLLANLGFGIVVQLGLRRAGRRLVGAGGDPGRQERWLERLAGATLARLAAELAELDAEPPRFEGSAQGPPANTPAAPR